MISSEKSIYQRETAEISRWWIAAGLFFVVLSVYVLSSPGRIDIVDGQTRFDVSYNLVVQGHPVVTDKWLQPFMAIPGRNGDYYSYFGAPASVFGMPLVWAGVHWGRQDAELSRFLFSMTSTIFGAAISVILYLFFIELGFSVQKSLLWSLVSTFTTMLWPISNSSFDNAQHAFFSITALYLGFLSARRNSRTLAAAAGLAAAVLVLYQEYFLIIVPVLGIATLKWQSDDVEEPDVVHESSFKPYTGFLAGARNDLRTLYELLRTAIRKPGAERASCVRFLTYFATAIIVSMVLTAVYNYARFGSYFENGKLRFQAIRVFPMFGNPLAGFSTLIFSPGKSVFLYSPPLILGFLGMRYLRRQRRELAFATMVGSMVLVAFISCIAFAGGDWCWGPRYMSVLLPLWALAIPYAMQEHRIRRDVVLAIVAVGLLVQVLGLAVENQRFFFARSLHDFFWAEDPWFYFKHSALLARVGETISLNDGPPKTAHLFNSIPFSDWSTYSVMGPPAIIPRSMAPQWMLYFKVYYLPRPWPYWMSWINPGLRPINLQAWVTALLATGLAGLGFIYKGFHPRAKADAPQITTVEQEVRP